MPTQHFDILIHAPRDTVWRAMLQSPTYEQWTTAFRAGSRYEGSWDQGQTIRFLDPQGQGMVATWPKALSRLKALCEGEQP